MVGDGAALPDHTSKRAARVAGQNADLNSQRLDLGLRHTGPASARRAARVDLQYTIDGRDTRVREIGVQLSAR